MTKRTLAVLAIALMLVAFESRGEMHPYSEPLSFGGYVDDIGPFVEGAFQRHGWRFQPRDDDGNYAATLTYKGFDIDVRVATANDQLVVDVVKVNWIECGGGCGDLRREPHVERWVANLRRTIALDITHKVREHLAR